VGEVDGGVSKMVVELVAEKGQSIFPSNTDWEMLKVDLETLSKSQLDLIFRLVEQMKSVNRENQNTETASGDFY